VYKTVWSYWQQSCQNPYDIFDYVLSTIQVFREPVFTYILNNNVNNKVLHGILFTIFTAIWSSSAWLFNLKLKVHSMLICLNYHIFNWKIWRVETTDSRAI
jgi:hypothetical protein